MHIHFSFVHNMGRFNITFKSVIYNSVANFVESKNNSYTNCKLTCEIMSY